MPWKSPARTVTLALIALTATTVLVAGRSWGESAAPPVRKLPEYTKTDAEKVKASSLAVRKLGFKLLLALDDEKSNLLLAPQSVGVLLAILSAGAEEEAREQLAKLIGGVGLSDEELLAAMREAASLDGSGDDRVTIGGACMMMTSNELKLRDDFLKRIEVLGVERMVGNPSDPADWERADAWVKRQTRDRLGAGARPSDKDTVKCTLFAMSFEGKWTHKFDEKHTSEQSFKTAGGGSVMVMRMHLNKHPVSELDVKHCQACRLPYGGGRFSFELYLPDRDKTIKQVLKAIADGSKASGEELEERKANIGLPRLELQCELNPTDELKKLAPKAFRWEALGRMVDQKVVATRLSQVLQSTALTLNESGTDAVAVARADQVKSVEKPKKKEPLDLICDRPFVFAIVDTKTDATLFVGIVRDPTKK